MIMTQIYGNKNKTLTYQTGLSKMTGSMVSAVMLHFLIQNWERTRQPLYWFNRPCDHPKYNTGRSWEENLGLSIEDIKYGLGFIGSHITRRTTRENVLSDIRPSFDIKGKLVNANHLVMYYTKSGLTYYELNIPLVSKAVEVSVNEEWKNYMAPLSDTMRELEEERRSRRVDGSKISSFRDMIIPELSEGFKIEDAE